MKHEIINQGAYLLLVTERGVYEGWAYHPTSNSVYRFGDLITSFERKVIAHLPLNGSPILEGVDLLSPLEEKDEAEKLALDIFPRHENWLLNSDNAATRPIWIDGYNQAKEKYKYTDEDLYMLAAFVTDFIAGRKGDFMTTTPKNVADKFIQSLSQPKMPVGFECAMEKDFRYNDDGEPFGFKVHNSDKIKTTTTPEGHTQWVGKYIYE